MSEEQQARLERARTWECVIEPGHHYKAVAAAGVFCVERVVPWSPIRGAKGLEGFDATVHLSISGKLGKVVRTASASVMCGPGWERVPPPPKPSAEDEDATAIWSGRVTPTNPS